MQSLEERMLKLERSVSRWRLGALGGAFLLVCGFILGAGPGARDSSFDEITARSIRLVDEGGHDGIKLGVGNHQSMITVMCPDPDDHGNHWTRVHAWTGEASVHVESSPETIDLKTDDKEIPSIEVGDRVKGEFFKSPSSPQRATK